MCEIQLNIFNRFSEFDNTTVSCCNLSINQIQMESLTNIKSFVLMKGGIESSKLWSMKYYFCKKAQKKIKWQGQKKKKNSLCVKKKSVGKD